MNKSIYLKIHNIGLRPEHDFLAVKEIRIMNMFNFFAFILSFTYGLFLLLVKQPYLAFFDFYISILSIIGIAINYLKQHKLSTFLIFALLPLILLSISYVYGGAGCEYYLFPFIVILVYFKKSTKTIIFFLLYYILVFSLMKFCEREVSVEAKISELEQYFLYVNLTASLIILFIFLRFFTLEYETNRKMLAIKNIELAEKNSELIERNKKIEVLLKEISHRTKNNLQLISSLINLQSSDIKDSKEKTILDDVKSRIYTIALVHKKLYLSSKSNEIVLSDYISELVQSILNSLSTNDIDFILEDYSNNRYASIDDAVYLGILVNEIISNSIEHGLKNADEKTISMQIDNLSDDKIKIKISDTGTGINALNSESNHGFGFSLVKSMLEQLEAEFRIFEDNGNHIELVIKLTTNEKDSNN